MTEMLTNFTWSINKCVHRRPDKTESSITSDNGTKQESLWLRLHACFTEILRYFPFSEKPHRRVTNMLCFKSTNAAIREQAAFLCAFLT